MLLLKIAPKINQTGENNQQKNYRNNVILYVLVLHVKPQKSPQKIAPLCSAMNKYTYGAKYVNMEFLLCKNNAASTIYNPASTRYLRTASFQSGSGSKPIRTSLLLSSLEFFGRAALLRPYSSVVTGITFVSKPYWR